MSSPEQSSDQEEYMYNLQTSEGKPIKKEFELSFEEDEVGESTMNKGFVIPQNSINARRGDGIGTKNNRDFLLRHHLDQDDPPEVDDYYSSLVVPPHNQQKNTLMGGHPQQHPGHLSYLSSSNCSPEVVRVPEDYYNTSSSD